MAMRLSPNLSRRSRRFFFFIHLWTGLILGLWFALIGVTGSLLAWMPELTAREVLSIYPHEKPSENASYIPISQVVSALKVAQPKAQPKSWLLPTGRYPYYIVFGRGPKQETMVTLIDPYSGKVHPEFRFADLWMGKVNEFHVSLLAGVPGLLANGLFSLFGVFMLLSGLWLWWPSTVGQLKTRLTVKRGTSLRRTLMDLHNVLGIYLYIILFVTTLTAVLLVANTATRGGIEKAVDKRSGIAEEKPPVIVPQGQRLTDDRLVELARETVPDAGLDTVRLPLQPSQPFQALFLRQGGFLSKSIVTIDPYSGKVLQLEDDRTASPGHKTMSLVEDLHFGFFGGIWSKLLYTFAGIVPVGLFLTGIMMWWKRKQSERNLKRRRTTESEVVQETVTT